MTGSPPSLVVNVTRVAGLNYIRYNSRPSHLRLKNALINLSRLTQQNFDKLFAKLPLDLVLKRLVLTNFNGGISRF